MLVGVEGMLKDIVRAAIADEPDLVLVEAGAVLSDDLAASISRRHVDVVIYQAGGDRLPTIGVDQLLRANPRLGLVAIDVGNDRGTMHRLIPAHDVFTGLSRASLIEAIRASIALSAGRMARRR
jgi:hypothetical protein